MRAPASNSLGRAGLVFYTALAVVLVCFGIFFDRMSSAVRTSPETAPLHAQLERDRASPEVLRVAKWAVDTQDHGRLPFFVVDKAHARIFSFDGTGKLAGSAPVLLGSRRGDAAAVPFTPAGRFEGSSWRSLASDGIVWVNHDAALTLHPISSPVSPGRASQRLASDAVEDKRISDGSLHVADAFYANHLGPLRGRASVVYVLPEIRAPQETFVQAPPSFPSPRSPS
ncbi:hypothetical protein [Caenimonas aquaedulcis]|uniref:Uncharacterized protein n=1 Tax=Caenimonas aquaedulcis TaxID=2793270 RepID=A0A931H4D2_9BURK|nr:hypothetical protein [Caenimonas aquaedulcis]MBG9388346.1 hypothetical protein [Caenimonas aquaedulcis]